MSASRETNQRPRSLPVPGSFVPNYHREMLMDRRRVRAFHRAIDHHASPTRSFVELGAGTGVMVAHAARRFGRVFAVERDPAMFEVCRGNLERLGLLNHNVTLIQGDALEVDVPRADIIMAEMLSMLMIHEPEVPVMTRARALLEPGGALIPARVTNLVTLGWSNFETQGIRFLSPYSLFTGVAPPEVLSESRVFFTAEFAGREIPPSVSVEVEVDCLAGGCVNCLILNSILELAPGITFGSSDSLNPVMVFPIEPVEVGAGGRARITITYRHCTDWNQFRGKVDVA